MEKLLDVLCMRRAYICVAHLVPEGHMGMDREIDESKVCCR